jgi:hypothetical protein
MRRRGRSAVWAATVGAACLAVGAGATFACTNLATINLSTSMGKPGDAVTVTGSGFLSNADEMPMDGMVMDMGPGSSGTMDMSKLPVRSPVVLHWNGAEGPVLGDAVPDRSGTISVLFTIPESPAGQYTVVAVQKNTHGVDVYGTPARAGIQVLGPGQSRADAARSSGSAGAGGQSSSTGLLALTVGLGALGVGLVAAGAVAAGRVVTARRRVPQRVDGPSD